MRLSPKYVLSILLLFPQLILAKKNLQQNSSTPILCSQLLTPLKIMAGKEVWLRTKEQFSYQDPKYNFEFMANLSPEGTFTLQMRLKDLEMGIRSHYKASDLYQRAFEHFGPFNIKAVESQWSYGDNHETFHKLIKKGTPKDVAAQSTWSGKMLTELGLSEISFIELEYNHVSGKHDKVHVIFKRPSPKQLPVKQGTETFELTEDVFSYSDSVFGFSFFAMIYGDGQVFISAELLNKELEVRSRFSGKQLFEEMINHFGKDNINVIEDLYHGHSINRDQYFTHRSNGLSPEESALNTWSGQRAREHGFTEVFDVGECWEDELYDKLFSKRRMGGRHLVHAKFRRPKQ